LHDLDASLVRFVRLLSQLERSSQVGPELDMGPFLLTQSNQIHQLMDPI